MLAITRGPSKGVVAGPNQGTQLFRRLCGRFLPLVLGIGGLSVPAMGSTPFFDWEVPSQPAPAGFLGAPSLYNNAASAAAVQSYWNAHPGSIKAVKVIQDLTNPAALNLFKTNAVKYVFADFEGSSVDARTATLVNQVRGGDKKKQYTLSAGAYIGNYDLYPLSPDKHGKKHGNGNDSGYYDVGVNMATESLYPGEPQFPLPGSGTTSPNIRSALFTLPIAKFSQVETNLQDKQFNDRKAPLPKVDAHIPYVTRFNNWGNAALDNSTLPYSPYTFDTSKPGAANQLLARSDFSAMIAHYRARGADSFHLFEPGVVGYTKAQMQSDAVTGWGVFDPLFANGKTAEPATLATNAWIDGNRKSFEEKGMVWSGMVRDPDKNAGTPDLFVIVSNLSATSHTISFKDSVDCLPFKAGNSFSVAAGDHRLIQFSAVCGVWNMLSNQSLSTAEAAWPDDNRNGIGIPEPSLGLASLAGAGLLLVRRRRRV